MRKYDGDAIVDACFCLFCMRREGAGCEGRQAGLVGWVEKVGGSEDEVAVNVKVVVDRIGRGVVFAKI